MHPLSLLFQQLAAGENNETFTRLVFHRLWLDEFHRHRFHARHGGIFSATVFVGNLTQILINIALRPIAKLSRSEYGRVVPLYLGVQ